MIYDNVIKKILNQNPDLCDWESWEELGIYNPVSVAQYQHYIPITWRHGMMHDFRDLRFFQADGRELDFWNESQTAGSNGVFWPKVEKASQNKIYCFYGNPDAVSRSSGTKTFDFFDDFLGSSLAAIWQDSNSPTITVTNSTVQVHATAAGFQGKYANVSFGVNYATRSYAKATSSGSATCYPIFGFSDIGAGFGNRAIIFYNLGATPRNIYAQNENGGSQTNTDTGVNCDTNYHVFESRRNSTSNCVHTIDSTATTVSTNVHTGSLYPTIANYGTSSDLILDWLLVRKYTATEPTVQVLSYGNRNPEYR